jgi:hypothetical protein
VKWRVELPLTALKVKPLFGHRAGGRQCHKTLKELYGRDTDGRFWRWGLVSLEGSVEDPVVSVWPCDGVGVAVLLHRMGGMAEHEGLLPAFTGLVVVFLSGISLSPSLTWHISRLVKGHCATPKQNFWISHSRSFTNEFLLLSFAP